MIQEEKQEAPDEQEQSEDESSNSIEQNEFIDLGEE